MSPNPDKPPVLTDTTAKLKAFLGEAVKPIETHGLVAVAQLGRDAPVIVRPHDGPTGPMLRIGCLAAEAVDWSTPGVPAFCLRESSRLLMGNIELAGNGLVVEHVVFADASSEQLAAIVFAVARAALELERDLTLMGALTMPPDGEAA